MTDEQNFQSSQYVILSEAKNLRGDTTCRASLSGTLNVRGKLARYIRDFPQGEGQGGDDCQHRRICLRWMDLGGWGDTFSLTLSVEGGEIGAICNTFSEVFRSP